MTEQRYFGIKLFLYLKGTIPLFVAKFLIAACKAKILEKLRPEAEEKMSNSSGYSGSVKYWASMKYHIQLMESTTVSDLVSCAGRFYLELLHNAYISDKIHSCPLYTTHKFSSPARPLNWLLELMTKGSHPINKSVSVWILSKGDGHVRIQFF